MINLSYLDEIIEKLKDRNKRIEKTLLDMGESVPEIKQKSNKSFSFKTDAKTLKELKVACIMDRFTYYSFKDECNLLELSINNWKDEIDGFKPDLIFIESAWEGKDKQWHKKIANGSKEFFDMACYCQGKNIPIVFWCKEDPGHTDVFMPVAKMANFVFTTDIDCIKRYKLEVGHDNVYHLHFAAQPSIHNPIEKYDRKDKFCFAGAYYHRFKERSKIFDNFSKVFINEKGLDIYDRNYQNALPEHAFPDFYKPYILGKLEPDEIDIAYKGYYYGINMNSESQSQTMFARRVFEMLSSNTVVIGNYSRGVKNLFGDLTICTDNSDQMKKEFKLFCSNETLMRKYRLLGLRKVLKQHLYEDRLDYIVTKVFKKSLKKQSPKVILFAFGENGIKSFKRQTYSNKVLYVVNFNGTEEENVKFITDKQALEILKSVEKSDFIGFLDEKNYYGKNYLMDIMLSLRYGEFDGISKAGYYSFEKDTFILNNKDSVYKPVYEVNLERGVTKADLISDIDYSIFDTPKIKCHKGISVDEFNYCENFEGENCLCVDDHIIFDQGIDIEKVQDAAENIQINRILSTGLRLSGAELEKNIDHKKLKKIKITKSIGKSLELSSNLNDSEVEYVYFEKLYETSKYMTDNSINFSFDCIGGTDVLGVCIFYDKNNKKLSADFPKTNRSSSSQVPADAVAFKLGLRIRGQGNITLKSICIGIEKNYSNIGTFLSRSNVLILTNHYPSYEDLYKNMFVHKRLLSYKEDGLVCDVMRMNIYAKNVNREFEGINVVEGYCDKLENILSHGNVDTVCVHFLDRQMWDVLKEFKDKLKIIIWSHGADIQPWWRREFNITSKDDEQRAKKSSEERMALWKEVFECKNCNISFVYVSEYFANEIFEDYKIKLPKDKYFIIHNLIDTNLFSYKEKEPELRKKILTIKPFSSRKYANDLTTKAILELSKKDFFDQLEFDIYGDGDLFETENKPLEKFKNVHLHKKFLKQSEIKALHDKHGIFIASTRWDSQGVSRDEAMSSGLVPITNSVSAIPEFVDENSGILVPAEDFKGITEGIEKLYFNPDEFLRLSKNAAKRVREQSSKEFTIKKEEKLINGFKHI